MSLVHDEVDRQAATVHRGPDAPFLDATRMACDAIVVECVEMVDGLLEAELLDRAFLAAFAELVRAGGKHLVADVGGGPGRVTALLRRRGVDAFGIDPPGG